MATSLRIPVFSTTRISVFSSIQPPARRLTVGLTVEIKLRFQISPAQWGRDLTMPTSLFFYYAPLLYGIGSITSRCSGKEPALKRRKSSLQMAEKRTIPNGVGSRTLILLMTPSLTIKRKLHCRSRKQKRKNKPMTMFDSGPCNWLVLLLLLPTPTT